MTLDEFFVFKLGATVNATEDKPKKKLVVVERLYAEFLDPNKPRRILYACKDNVTGGTEFYPQMALEPWHENRKIVLARS